MKRLGKVIWFGTKNYDTGKRKNDYGFLQSFDKTQEIFFHYTGIAENSIFLEEYQEGDFVIYEMAPSFLKEKGEMAIEVKLFCEATEKEKNDIIKNEAAVNFLPHLSNTTIKEIFLEKCEELSLKRFLENFHHNLRLPILEKIFLQKCKNLSIEVLKEQLKDVLSDVQVRRILLREMPDLYLGEDPKNYFEIIFHEFNYERSYFPMHFQNNFSERDYVKELFLKRYEIGGFQTSIVRDFCQWFSEKIKKNNPLAYQNKVLTDNIWKKIDWCKESKESIEAVINFLELLKKNNISVEMILKQRTELLFENPELCKKITPQDLAFVKEKQIVYNEEQLKFFMNHFEFWTKRFLLGYVSKELLLASEEALKLLDDAKILEIIKEIDWNCTEEFYLTKYEKILKLVEADLHQNAALGIAVSMRNRRVSFQVE